MAPHSSTLAWKIPWMEEPGGLAVQGAARSRTRLSDFTFTFHFHALEEEMATHSSVPAWRIPGTGEPGGLPSVGSQSRTRLKRRSSGYIVVHTLNVPNLPILSLLDFRAFYSSLLLRISFACIYFMSWMGINET